MKTLALQLQGYLDHLTIERGVAANTLSSYRRDLRRYSKHLDVAVLDQDERTSIRRAHQDGEQRLVKHCRADAGRSTRCGPPASTAGTRCRRS